MQITEFSDYAQRLEGDEDSGRVTLEVLGQLDGDDFRMAVAMITRDTFDNIGVGKATIRNIAVSCFDVKEDTLKSWESDLGGLPHAVHKAAMHTERLVPRDDVSLAELWTDLNEIQNDEVDQDRKITEMLSDYKEPKWIAHSLLGSDGVTLGIGRSTVAKVCQERSSVDENRRRVRALTPDIVELCYDLMKNDTARTEPEVGEPFLPMLAKSKEPETDFDEDEWMVQRKFDGARILLHVDDDDYWAFSRNAKEVTDSMPELEAVVDALPEGQFILDGEVVPYKDGEQVSFQHVMRRFNRKNDIEEQDIDLEFRFFDLVYGYAGEEHDYLWDGDLTRLGNWERVYAMMWILPENPEFRAETGKLDDHDQLMEAFTQALDDGREGLIVKNTEAEYEFDRRSPNWRKMVSDNENIDLEIVEVIEGEDNQAGMCGALRLKTSDDYVVGKVGTGFGTEMANEIWERREELVGSIVEISWRDLQENEDGTFGVRFPAFEGLRPDKDEADTIDRLQQIDSN